MRSLGTPKAVTHKEEHRRVLANLRTPIGELDQDLKTDRDQLAAAPRLGWAARCAALVEQRTGSATRNGVREELRAHHADGRRVRERPEIPVPTNALASAIRAFVKRRQSSGGTRSDAGRRGRDPFASLKKTCRQLGLRFGDSWPARVRGLGHIPRPADLIRPKAQERAVAPAAAVPV
jgi:hypothetical protein